MGKIDNTDMKILTELVKDSSVSVPKLSRRINVNSSVAYSRIKRLVRRGLIRRFTLEVNDELLGYNVRAVVGVNIDSKLRQDIMAELLQLEDVQNLVEITGRFDLLVMVRTKSLDDLHEFVSGKLGRMNGVTHTETFLEMKRRTKLPSYSLK